MFFFKLMFLKKKKKLDNKGAALANVLLITTFVMVITSSVLSMAYNTYRMKLINVSSKDNLYACEAVLEQVRVGFRNQFTEITDALTETTATTIASAFEEFYKDYALDGYYVGDGNLVGESMSGTGIYYYDIFKVAQLLTSISGTNNSTVIVTADAPYASLVYDESKPVFTSSVDITVDNSEYNNIKVTLQADATGKNNFELTKTYVTFHDLTVIYSENGYESEVTTDITIEFPEVGTASSGSGSSGSLGNGVVGWVDVSDMTNIYSDWKSLIDSGNATDFSIGSVPMTGNNNDAVYISTVDYPANSISSVIFEMKRYEVTTNYADEYVHNAIYPWVQVQNGSGTGAQYAACKQYYFDNVYIYIGDKAGGEENDENWVKYTAVFNSNNYINYSDLSDTTSAAYRYYMAYDYDDLQDKDSSPDEVINPTLKYKVMLYDVENPSSRMKNSRGWILITGGGGSGTIQPELNGEFKIYVDIENDRSLPTYYFYNNGNYGSTGTIYTEAADKKSENNSSYGPSQYYNYLYIDFSESNYHVGDVLHITLYNIVDYTSYNAWGYSIDVKDENSFTAANGQLYPSPTSALEGGKYEGICDVEFKTTTNSKNETVYIEDIEIEVTWDLYPFICIQFTGATDEVTVDMEWTSGDGTTVTGTTTGTTSDAVIYYEDWRKE